MDNLAKALIVLSVIAFVLAVVATLAGGGKILGVSPEAFSRACTNLALIAIGWVICFKGQTSQG